MAKTLANCSIWFDQLAIASQVNQVAIDMSAAELDITTFANAGRARIAGLRDAMLSIAGLWEADSPGGDPDATIYSDVGTIIPVTVALARNAAAGAVAYLLAANVASYGGIGAKVGNPLAFSIKASQAGVTLGNGGNGGRLAQGVLAENRTVTASGAGNIYGPLPAPLAMQAMVAALHLISLAGTTPSITVNLISSASVTMSSPTTRVTWTGLNAVTGLAAEIDGPITDTYWQFTWTVAGTTPSIAFAASLGNAY